MDRTIIIIPIANITGKSCDEIDWTKRRPIPGTEKTVSVTTAPPVSWPRDNPIYVTTGRIELGRTWRNDIRPSESPLARATLMNSC